MKTRAQIASFTFGLFLVLVCLGGCGGGGGSPGGGGGGSSGPPAITTPSILPGTLTGHAYTVTLTVVGGQGALHWSIAPISPTALFPTGLSIDANTGVISGTANFAGTAGFIATVTDSASPAQSGTKNFTVTATSPLQVASQTFTISQYADLVPITLNVQGGVSPLSFSLTAGSLPVGLRLDRTSGRISGSPITIGTYQTTLTVQDSFSPPEIVSAQLTILVIPLPLSVANSLPPRLPLNRPFNGRVVALGGVPPYHFALGAGSSLPPGLSSVDPSSGFISGTPTALGSFFLTVNATDSSSPPLNASASFLITVANPLGRNDTPATATPIGNGVIMASISPYVDPPNGVPLPGDNDYYKVASLGGATVHLETQAQRLYVNNPLDTVLEVVDAGGIRFNTCRQPGDTSANFVSPCMNDDISTSPVVRDSALDFQVPGATNAPTTFYVHVLDWRGDARPDMNYSLQVSGVVPPLTIQTSSLLPAARGLSYSQQLSAANATGVVSWSVVGGSLPPGLTLSTAGAITGSATSNGIYSFTVQASDSHNPPQVVQAQETIRVVDPVVITSSPTFPDACVNQPYSFKMQTSGGAPPLVWTFVSQSWVSINLDQSTGVFSGTANVTGTFTGLVGVNDATTHGDSQHVTLTVRQCP